MSGVRRLLKPGKFPYSSSWAAASFSSGIGRGRGGAAIPPPETATPIGKPPDDNNESETGFRFVTGRCRAGLPTQTKAMPENDERSQETPEATQTRNEHSPFQSWAPENPVGREAGRGRGTPFGVKPDRKPVSEGLGASVKTKEPSEGLGRGKPEQQPPGGGQVSREVNRHARSGRPVTPSGGGGQRPGQPRAVPAGPRLKGEEAIKQAMAVLAKRAEAAGDTPGPGRGGGGDRGRGRGRGRGVGRGRGRDWGRDRRQTEGAEDADALDELFDEDSNVDDDELEKELVKEFGEETWRVLSPAIDRVCEKFDFDPSSYPIAGSSYPIAGSYADALHTSYMLEYEPEYAMEDFGTNPDIDEKPPISLREFLEESKPLLFATGQIETEEEWKQQLEEAMKNVPHTRDLLHYYAGHGRLNSRKEQEHLKSVASRLPDHAHQSVKKLADRAVLSLQ